MNSALSQTSSAIPLGTSVAGPVANSVANPQGRRSRAARLADDFAHADPATRAEVQFARRVAARLDQSSAELPADVSERLRFARELALQKARLARVAEAAACVTSSDDTAPRGAAGRHVGKRVGEQSSGIKRWWLRVAAAVPLLALVGGLVLIQRVHATAQIKAAADIDSALLADDLPPSAYADPAFAEFLKAPRD